MALHSICHPGLPGPQGLSQNGSPGFEDCKIALEIHNKFQTKLRFQ